MKEFWKVMMRYVPPYKKYVFASVLLNILSAVFNIFSFTLIIPILQILFNINEMNYEFIPFDSVDASIKDVVVNNLYYFASQAIDSIGAGSVLLLLCLFLIFTTILKTACYFGSASVNVPLSNGITRDLRNQIYNKILSLPMGYFSDERKGDLLARITGDVGVVENTITSTLDMLIKNPILIVFYITTLFVISWQLTLFVIVFAPLMLLLLSAISRKLKAQSVELQNIWSDLISQVEETLGGLRVIKAFVAESKMSARFCNATDALRKKGNRVSIRQASGHPVSECLGTAMIAIVLWFGGTLILSSKAPIDAPTFIFYMVILYSVIQPIKDLAKSVYGIPRGMASVERLDDILKADNPLKNAPQASQITDFNDGISLEHIVFSYNGTRTILKDVCLDIKKGQTVAIVGSSGAGKTTLVDLIPRFYDPVQGSIKIDGKDIRDIKISSLRGLMGNVNQDPILFNDTIFNNIAFGVENATMEQVVEAAKIANAHEFIMEKPDGYNERIGDRGCKLSGGQRQRISIARAILKNPPILILDEATASLDTESERIVQEALDRLMSNRTTIAIAHRLSTIKNADVIIVMADGEIVERGKHEELISRDGVYKHLYEMQAL